MYIPQSLCGPTIWRTQTAVVDRDVYSAHYDLNARTDSLFGLHQFLRSSLLVHDWHHRSCTRRMTEPSEILSVPSLLDIPVVVAVEPSLQPTRIAQHEIMDDNCCSMYGYYRIINTAIVPSLSVLSHLIDSGEKNKRLDGSVVPANTSPFQDLIQNLLKTAKRS